MGQVDDFLGDLLGTTVVSRELKSFKRLVVERLGLVDARIVKLEEIIMTLADTIKQLVAIELNEGKALVEANVKLANSLQRGECQPISQGS